MELCKRGIVLVGHSVAARRLLQLSLNLEGYRVHAAETPAEARALIDEHWPEAVVIDTGLGTPALYGLARGIRQSRFHRHIVVVASAPVSFPGHERAAYEAGCDAFVVQPGQTRELAELLESYLMSGTATGTALDGRHEAPQSHWN